MKGILLAGGNGTRLGSLTTSVSKQLLPIYDRPMITYPLETLRDCGVEEVLIITRPEDERTFMRLLGDGAAYGVRLEYEVQPRPEGIAQALLIGQFFLRRDSVALALGDNLFFGLNTPQWSEENAHIFGCRVEDPERYGVLNIDMQGKVRAIVEKPVKALSPYAVPGLYFYPSDVVEIARNLTPSPRGELEITDVNNEYLRQGRLDVTLLGPETVWFDAGTPEDLWRAGTYVWSRRD